MRHYCNSSHYSTFFNFRGLQPAFGQGLLNSDSHTFAHEPLPRCSFKLVQSQLLVQVLVREAFLSLSLLLELRT